MLARQLESAFPIARWLCASLAAVTLLAAPGTAQDARRAAALERAEKKLERTEAERDAVHRELVEDYNRCEKWWLFDDEGPPPETVTRWFDSQEIGPDRYAARREALRADSKYHEFWNGSLYKVSRVAKRYTEAVTALERAFIAVERLRHPERFQRGFTKTPEGMALIASGRYTLGPATGDILEQPDVQKERTVKLRQFYLDRREVSCAEYAKFLMAQPPGLLEENLPGGWSITPDGSPLYPEGFGSFPVTNLTWVSASRYAEWIGKRLPTEDEWEAAAAGNDRRLYPVGPQYSSRKINSKPTGIMAPRSPNEFSEDHTPLGILCMAGNVREWTASGFNGRPIKTIAPDDYASVRGGSYLDEPDACRSTYRWLFQAFERYPHVGFRCAKDIR